MTKKASLLILLWVLNCLLLQPLFATKDFTVGDYITFGSYFEQPILWRVIHLDQEGNPLLYSEHILCAKSFDAAGSNHDNLDRKQFGSNDWESSSIRQWLNSKEERINWSKNYPSFQNIDTSWDWGAFYAPYDQEKGFLANGNFTQEERNIILPVIHKVLLTDSDKQTKNGGTELHLYNSSPYSAVQNYDDAYYKVLKDSVFFLSVYELKHLVIDRGYKRWTTPTNSAVNDSSLYRTITYFETDIPFPNWLRTPETSTSFRVRRSGCNLLSQRAYESSGVRPALYINRDLTIVGSGDGSIERPYYISGSGSLSPKTTRTQIVTEKFASVTTARVNVNNVQTSFEAYLIEGHHYFKLRDIAKVVSGTKKQFEVIWEKGTNSITLISGLPYTVVGGELLAGEGSDQMVIRSVSHTFKDKLPVILTAYTISGNNFFKLRDIAQTFDIGVTWDPILKTVGIDTSTSYED